MRRQLWWTIGMLMVMGFSFDGFAASQWELGSETLVRSFERTDDQNRQTSIMAAYQYLSVDWGNAEEGGVSVHLHGWGRKDLTGTDFYEQDPDGELLYGFLEYARPYSAISARMGRQHIFSATARDTVDGLQLSGGWSNGFSFSAYGGLPVAFSDDNGTGGDLTYGGRVAQRIGRPVEIGLSYQFISDNSLDIDKTAAVDLTTLLGDNFTFNGLSAYNADTASWREHRYTLSMQWDDIGLTPSYQFFSYQDYFGNSRPSANLFHFLSETEEQIGIAGIEGHYTGWALLDIGLRVRQYTYALRSESATYWAGLVNLNGPANIQTGLEAGRMDGGSDDNRYDLYRGYLLWPEPFAGMNGGQISLDLLYLAYDAPIFERDSSLTISLAADRPFAHEMVVLRFRLDYSRDPYFDEDLQALLSLLINI